MRTVCVLVLGAAVLGAADKPDGGRAVAGKEVVTLGGVTVSVSRIGLYPNFWRETGERTELTDNAKMLNIDVTVSTADGTKKVNYQTWRAVAGVQAVDKFGNKYELSREKSGQTFTGAIRKAVVSKGEPATDRLIFEKPIAAAEWVDIDLPGEAVGVKGEVFRFRVTREAWTPAQPKGKKK